MESLRDMGSEMMNCVGLFLILQVESNFVELIGQISRLMHLTLEYLKARISVLFLVYINGLPKVIENCTVAMYADDTRGASLDQLNETVNKDLESLGHWLKGNKLSLNIVKTVSMNILSRQKHQKILGELDLKIRDTNIQNLKETKYLGLQIDRRVTWK